MMLARQASSTGFALPAPSVPGTSVAVPRHARRAAIDPYTARKAAPLIVFNRKDELQWRYIRRHTRARVSPPVHYLPTSTGFVEAAALGLGWCLAPETLIASAVLAGRIEVLDNRHWLDVPLYWQSAAVRSGTLENVGRGLRDAAAAALRR